MKTYLDTHTSLTVPYKGYLMRLAYEVDFPETMKAVTHLGTSLVLLLHPYSPIEDTSISYPWMGYGLNAQYP